MALWSRVMVNSKSIGFIEVQRDPDQDHPTKNAVCSYTVRARVHGEEVREAQVKHRYGDGALVLLAKALAAVTEGTEDV